MLHTNGVVGRDVNVHCMASSENVVRLKMLLRSRCCYVRDFVTLKKLLCTHKCFQNGFVDVGRKNTHVHFAHGSLVDYGIFMSIKRKLKFQKNMESLLEKQN